MAAMRGQSSTRESSDSASDAGAPQTAEAVFKNIQVLKGIPSDQLIPAMRFISTSLGVECSYCHVQNAFQKDDKKPKQTARTMMRMMFAIDKNSFDGNREVTCYSCHRGSIKPQGTPLVAGEEAAKNSDHLVAENVAAASITAADLAAKSPTSDSLIDRYVIALGGAAAIEKITSREERGTTTVTGQSISTEIFEQDPGRLAVIRHMPDGRDAITALNGRDGWSSAPGRPVREMHGADLDAAQIDADLHFPLHIRQLFTELQVEYPEKVGDREAYVVSCKNVGKPPVKLYFDEESGLLIRLERYAASALGSTPMQIDYSDYRDVDGVKIPFRRITAQTDGISTIQIEQIQLNVPIDENRFAKPDLPAISPKPVAQ
jgi:photosynthetic reaction center cytochrome c subunit